MLEYAWGKPKEEIAVELESPENPLDVARMTREQRQALIARVVRENPELARSILGPAAVATGNGAKPDGDAPEASMP